MKSIEKFLNEMKKIDTSGELITEDTINELTEIFDAAVDIKATELKKQLEKEMTEEAETLKTEMVTEAETLRDEMVTEAEEFKEKLIDLLDKVLEKSINEFFDKYENQIEDDVKLVFYENFFNHVKDGFEKHNIELAETDIDMITALKKKLAEKDDVINSKINEIYELEENILGEQIKNVWNEKTRDMTDMEKAKLRGLIGDVDFSSLEEAKRKLNLFIEKFDEVEMEDQEEQENSFPAIKTNRQTSNDKIVSTWLSNM